MPKRRDGGGHLMREWRAGDVEPQPSQLAGQRTVRIIVADKDGTEQLHPVGQQWQSAAVSEYPLDVASAPTPGREPLRESTYAPPAAGTTYTAEA